MVLKLNFSKGLKKFFNFRFSTTQIRYYSRKMSSITTETTSNEICTLANVQPPSYKGIKKLDKSLFVRHFPIVCVFFPDAGKIGQFVKDHKKDILRYPRIPFIVKLDETKNNIKPSEKNKELKAVVLTEKLKDISKAEDILSQEAINDIKSFQGEFRDYDFTLDYSYWRSDEILKAILPDDFNEEVPSGFTKTGHIAHLNLKEEYKPYGELIGQVILDKNPSVKTVVDKLESIDTTFRTFKMKVIAGEDNFLVEQKESDCIFKFDFSKVYWNSRLSTEHGRLINEFKTNEAVCDVMSGVGPFAVPAGKKKCLVFANDLNPESYKYLEINVKNNKVQNFVKYFNTDGREFIKRSPKLLQEFNKNSKNGEIEIISNKRMKIDGFKTDKRVITKFKIPTFFSQYVMNLPDSAINFIDSYAGLFSNAFPDLTKDEVKNLPGYKLPIVNFHHFEKYSHEEDPQPTEEELHKRVHAKMTKILNYDVPFEKISFHLVRMVAPTKPMYCVSFELPEELAFQSASN